MFLFTTIDGFSDLPLRVPHIAPGRVIVGGKPDRAGLTEVTFYHRALGSQNHCLRSFHSKATPEGMFLGRYSHSSPCVIAACGDLETAVQAWDQNVSHQPQIRGGCGPFMSHQPVSCLPSWVSKQLAKRNIYVFHKQCQIFNIFSRGRLVDMTHCYRES